MKVAVVADDFPAPSETFVVRMVVGLLDAGVDVHVVRRDPQAPRWDQVPALEQVKELRERVHGGFLGPGASRRGKAGRLLRVVGVGVRRPTDTARVFRVYRQQGRRVSTRDLLTARHLAKLAPDVVHYQFGTLARLQAPLAGLIPGAVVVSFRGGDISFRGMEDAGFYDPVWRWADGLHFRSGDLLARGSARGAPSETPHRVIPSSVDTEFFKRPQPAHGSPAGAFRIVSVGRLHWKKAYELALLGVAELVKAGIDVEYRIIGEGERRVAVEAAIEDLHLRDRVRLLGQRSTAEVRDELMAADVLLHASVSEGFANAPLEAQAMELPVVAADADGMHENLLDGKTGFVVPKRDPRALAEALRALADDPARRRAMGAEGRAHVQRNFSPESEMDGYRALYLDAVQFRDHRG